MSALTQSPLRQLLLHFPREGRLEWIGVRPRYRAAVEAVMEVEALADHGLSGDHVVTGAGGKRQVTLIQWEHLHVVARLMGRERIDPALLRRNLAVSGVNLLSLRQSTFAVGKAILVGTGVCAPCSRMEEALGIGGLNAMRGHGGITARILQSGTLRLGDAVRWLSVNEEATEEL